MTKTERELRDFKGWLQDSRVILLAGLKKIGYSQADGESELEDYYTRRWRVEGLEREAEVEREQTK